MRLTLHKILFYCLVVVTVFAASAAGANEASGQEPEEGFRLNTLMQKAAAYEAAAESDEEYWQAAVMYCEAAKLGSTEAQYRLGMLYLIGKGVPENRAYAASLFSMASQQGHRQAFDMLETVSFKEQTLPTCLLSDALPEKGAGYAGDAVQIDRYLQTLPRSKSWIIHLTRKIADRYDVDPHFVLSIMTVESNFQTGAQSPKSAMGLMQLIPKTAERFNVKNAFDASQNIRGGVRYLRWLLSYYRGNIELVTAAYNAGEKAVDRYVGIPPYPETRDYVKRLKRLYQRKMHTYDETLTAPSPIMLRKVSLSR